MFILEAEKIRLVPPLFEHAYLKASLKKKRVKMSGNAFSSLISKYRSSDGETEFCG